MNWLNNLLEKFDRWSRDHEDRALEYYLSKSQNIADLENRMRTWQNSNQQARSLLRF